MTLDRTQAPDFQVIDKIDMLQAQTQTLANGTLLHLLNVGDQPVLKLELIFINSLQEIKTGVSYFALKMLGEGTSHRTSTEIIDFADGYGAFLEFNHGTDRYGITLFCLSKYLGKLLPLLQEILTESTFPEKELQNLKTITAQNIKLNEEKNSYVAGKRFRELIFGVSHPYGKYLSEAHINEIDRAGLQHYFEQYIREYPYEIILSGKVGEEEVDLIRNAFGQQKITPSIAVSNLPELPSIIETKELTEKADSLQSSLRIGRILFGKKHPDYLKFVVANEIFGGYFGSRLMKNIREEKGFTYGIYSGKVIMQHGAYWAVSTDVKKENTQQTLDEIAKEALKMQTELVTKDELETVRNYMLGSFAGSMNTAFELAEVFKGIYFHELDYTHYQRFIQTILTITLEEIQEIARKYFNIEEMLEVVVGGK